MAKLILVRHGQSEWNKLNLFTGWVDVPLSPEGIEEALACGRKIADIPIDVIVTSTLCRAHMTAFLAMSVHHSKKVPLVVHEGEWAAVHSESALKQTIPVIRAWQMNERYYGDLQGLNKDETRAKYGADQVQLWRRSYSTPPPNGESLEMTAQRSIPYFEETVLPLLESGKNVLISAHGNSLRSIIMDIDGLSKEEVVKLEIATGEPIIYDYVQGQLTRV